MAGIAATIGGSLTLVILKNAGKWDWWWLIPSGLLLVGGTMFVRFVPDFLYGSSRFPWVRTLTGIAVAAGGLVTFSGLQPASHWGSWHWLGTGILVVSGTIYILLPDLQRKKSSNYRFSIVKWCRRLFRKRMGN